MLLEKKEFHKDHVVNGFAILFDYGVSKSPSKYISFSSKYISCSFIIHFMDTLINKCLKKCFWVFYIHWIHLKLN
jgi:hypothetical protein